MASRVVVVALGVILSCGGRTPMDVDGGAADLAPAAATWDGGVLPSTPGVVRCGTSSCAAHSEECCLQEHGATASNGCGSRANATCNGTQDTRRCDETADCATGEVCCFSNVFSPPVTMGSYCVTVASGQAATCAMYDAVGCGSDADCDALSLPACVAQLCRGDVIQTCGRLPSAACDP